MNERGRDAERARDPHRRRATDWARLFVALDLDDDARRALARWCDGSAVAQAGEREASTDYESAITGIRPVAMDALHVTLCFLGTRAIEQADAIADACAIDSGAAIGGLRLGRAMWLPRRRPRVLAVEIEDATGALGRVQSAIAEALAEGGWYRPEARPFLPHVTVARVPGDGRLRRLPRLPSPPPMELAEAATVTLYRSRLSPTGASYEALRRIPVERRAAAVPEAGETPVAAVRRFHTAQAQAYAGDDLDLLRPLLTPDVIWHVPGRSLIAGEHRGVDAVLAYFDLRRRLTDETFRVTVHEIVAAGELVIQLAGGHAERGGVPVSWETVGIFRVAGGRIAECRLIPFDLYGFDEVWS